MLVEFRHTVGFAVVGVFTVVLGLVHFVMPWLLDFDGAIPIDGEALEPLNLLVAGGFTLLGLFHLAVLTTL